MRRRVSSAVLASVLTLASAPAPVSAQVCGDADALCEVDLGAYRIALPDGPGPYPTLVYLHGFGGSANGAMGRLEGAVDRGYAVIAPQGLRQGDGPSRWDFHPDFPDTRDEAAFFAQVLEDAAARHGIDRANVLFTGYSIGGSMTSYLACAEPGIARAYAPLAGAFWRPHPELQACTGAVDLYHVHGWRDGTVPLEGRVLGGGRIRQGDVFYALQVWRETNGCDAMAPDTFEITDEVWRRVWSACAGGSLTFDLHPGGHEVPAFWLDRALDWFESL